MMTNSKKILLFVASATFFFASCKKDTQDQTGSEQYYKSQLEKLIHLKETPSSSNAKGTSSFKTYKEAYEAFAFVRTGEILSDTVPAVRVAAPKGSRTDQARTDLIQYFVSSPSASKSLGMTSSISCTVIINFTSQWQPGPGEDEWIGSSAITKKSDPTYAYSGIGNITTFSSFWTGNSFSGNVQGQTTVAGTTFSWYVTTSGSVSINTPPKPWGEAPTVNFSFMATSH